MSELELSKCCFYCENRNSHYVDYHWCMVREEQVKLFCTVKKNLSRMMSLKLELSL